MTIYNIEKNRVSILNIGIFTLMYHAIWSFNVLGKSTSVIFIGGLMLIILLLFKNNEIRFSTIFIFYLIFIFGLTYSVILNIYHDYDFFRGYREIFLPTVMFLIGILSMDPNKTIDQNIDLFKNTFLILAVGLFIYSILNLIFHLTYYGDISISSRMIHDIWTGEQIQATAQGSKLTLMIALASSLLFLGNFYKKYTKLIIFSCAIISLIASLIMANRSTFIILIGSFVAANIVYLAISRKKITNYIRYIIVLVILSIVGIVVYNLDIFGIKSFILSSNLYSRVEGLNYYLNHDPRIAAWIKTLKGLYYFPFGGYNTDIYLNYAHNFWLDVGYAAGILPLSLLLIITYLYFLYFVKVLINIPDDNFKIFVSSLTTAVLLNLMIEPVLEGHYYLFMVFMLQLGLMKGLVDIVLNN